MTRCIRLFTLALLTGVAYSVAQAHAPRPVEPIAEAAAAADVTVHREPPQVQTKMFDPASPPPEMPPLKPGEAAVTESSFSCQTMIGVLVTSQQPTGSGTCRATVKVTSVTTTLRLGIVIWLPQDGPRKLTAHEEGHRIIDERYYAGAKAIAERLSREMIGDELTAEGSDCDAAAQAAISNAGNQLCGEYMAAVQFPAARAQALYDKLTDHGRNKIGEDPAIESAMKKQREEARADVETRGDPPYGGGSLTSGPDKFASTCCRGCTLTDLCIGLAIAAMLTAGVLPVVGRSRETAERVKCAGNLRQIAQAILLYSMANGGNLPRTLYDSNVSPTVSYTAWQASDPFASDGPGPNDITAALYLLLRTTDSIAETFVCPKTIATTEPWNYQGQSRSAFSNFPSRQYLSYSYTNVYGPVSQKLASLPALFVLAADMNPGPGAMTVTNASASQQMKGGNSANHDGDGQGVLYADGHVEFQQTPFVGVARDNIYTYGNSRTTAGSGINGPSTDGNDSVLLPTALDGPAPGPVGVAGTLRWLLPASAGLLLLMILLMWRTTRRNYAI